MQKRFTEEQLIKILEEGRSGLAVGALCRKYAIAFMACQCTSEGYNRARK